MNIKSFILIVVSCIMVSYLSILPAGKMYASKLIPGYPYHGYTVEWPFKL